MRNDPVCIVQNSPNEISETFIRAQHELISGALPVFGPRAEITFGQLISLRERCYLLAKRRLFGANTNRIAEMSYFYAFRRAKPCVVLANYGPIGVMVFPSCKALSIPMVVHFHGFDASRYETLARYHATYPALFRECAGVVVVSRAMFRRLENLGANRSKLHYIPCGVNVARIAPSDPSQAGLIFLAAGRFVEKKAPFLTLLAFRKVCDRYPEAMLRWAGEGKLLDSCIMLARSLGLANNVCFLGGLTHDRVISEMSRVRCFIQHSVRASDGDEEGTPVSILEASASGLPVVATSHNGINEAVLNNQSGILVPEYGIEAMADAMIHFAENPELARTMGNCGRRHIEEHYSQAIQMEKLNQVLSKAITSSAQQVEAKGDKSPLKT